MQLFEKPDSLKFSHKLSDYYFPILWCFLWFVVDPGLSSHRLLQINFVIRLLLFAYIFIKSIEANKLLKPGIVGWILLFGFIADSIHGNLFASLKWTLFYRNLGLLLILIFYLDNYEKLFTFIKIFLLYIFLTVILIGFYQYFTHISIYDSSKLRAFNPTFYLEAGRFTGLIYGTSNDAVSFILVLVFFLSSIVIAGFYKRGLSFLCLILTLFALFFTYTRAGWAAFLIGTMIFFYFGLKDKIGTWSKLLFLVIIFITLFYFFYFNLLVSSSHYERIISSVNLVTRFDFYGIVLDNMWKNILGNGLYSDPSDSFYTISRIYITTENQFLNWLLFIGLPGVLYILFRIFRQLFLLFLKLKNLKFYKEDYYLGLALLVSQVSVIISEMTTTNLYFLIILLYILIDVYLNKCYVLQSKPYNKTIT